MLESLVQLCWNHWFSYVGIIGSAMLESLVQLCWNQWFSYVGIIGSAMLESLVQLCWNHWFSYVGIGWWFGSRKDLTLSYCGTYIYVRNPEPVATSYIYIRTQTAIEIWGFYRRLTDTLRYHHTRCSRASGLLASVSQHVYQVGRKLEFTRSCPLFLPSFGKLEYNGGMYGFSAVKVKL